MNTSPPRNRFTFQVRVLFINDAVAPPPDADPPAARTALAAMLARSLAPYLCIMLARSQKAETVLFKSVH